MIPIPPWLWGLFINKYTIGGVIGLGLLAGAYLKGYMAARETCQDNALKAQIAAMQRDLAAWKAADKVEDMLTAELEADARELEQKVADYERELSKEPLDTRCTLNERDVDRLRGNGKR
jgi:hypothetical protein